MRTVPCWAGGRRSATRADGWAARGVRAGVGVAGGVGVEGVAGAAAGTTAFLAALGVAVVSLLFTFGAVRCATVFSDRRTASS
jgi:hypothetical protein